MSILESPIAWIIGICGTIIAVALVLLSGKKDTPTNNGTAAPTGTGTNGGAKASQSVYVSTPEQQSANGGRVISMSPIVEVYHAVDLYTPEQIAAYFKLDVNRILYIAASGTEIIVTMDNGSIKRYVNPNMLPKEVSYQNEAGQIVTKPPASANSPQTSVSQPVDVTNPPPVAPWANAFNRINLGGTSLNDDCYYHDGGITNKYGTYYTGYGAGTLPINQMPSGTTIGGLSPQQWIAKYGSGGSTAAPVIPPTPAPSPAVTPAPTTTPAAAKETVEMNDAPGQAAALAKARQMGYAGSDNMNSVASYFVDRGYRVHFAGSYFG